MYKSFFDQVSFFLLLLHFQKRVLMNSTLSKVVNFHGEVVSGFLRICKNSWGSTIWPPPFLSNWLIVGMKFVYQVEKSLPRTSK